MFRAGVVAACFAWAACASSQHPSAPSSSSPPPDARTRAVVPSRWIRAPEHGPLARVAAAGDRVQLIAGGLRAERIGTRATAGDNDLADPIVAALQGAQGWTVFTPNASYTSERFTGVLVERAHTDSGRIGRGTGLAVVIRGGRAEGIRIGPERVVLDAAWSDDRRGVVVVEPGDALRTEDGGTTWLAVPLHDDAALGAIADGEGRWIVASETAVAIGADGNAAEVPLERVPLPRQTHDVDDAESMQSVAANDGPSLMRTSLLGGVIDGTRVIVPTGAGVRAFDLAADRWAESMPLATCTPDTLFLAERLFAVCHDESGTRLFERSAEGEWRTRLASALQGAECVASDDGQSVACEGPCAGDSPPPGGMICMQHGLGSPVTTPAGDRSLIGFDGTQPLFFVSMDDEHVVLARLGGPDDPRPLEPSARYLGSLAPGAHLDHDGRLRFVLRRRDGRPGIVEGRPDGSFVFHEAPADTLQLALGADGHAIRLASTRTLEQTNDDGLTWSPVPLDPRTGVDSNTLLHDGVVIGCASAGCTLSRTLVRAGWGPPALSEQSALATVARPDWFEPRPRVECDVGTESLALADPAPIAAPGSNATTVDSPLGTLMVTESPAPRGREGSHVELAWVPRSTPTVQRMTRASFEIPRYSQPGHAARWVAVELTAHRARALRCGSGPAGLAARCDLLEVIPPRRATLVGSLPDREVSIALAEHDVALVTQVESLDPSEPSHAERWLTQRSGAAARVATVALSNDVGDAVGPYLLDDESGLVRFRSSGAIVLEPVGGTPRVLASATAADLCAADSHGDLAIAADGAFHARDHSTRRVTGTLHLGVRAGAVCLRSVDASVEQLGAWGWLHAEPGIDGLTGQARTRGAIDAVRCRLELPHPSQSSGPPVAGASLAPDASHRP